eukprot:2339683-Rhodomonas_salina.1
MHARRQTCKTAILLASLHIPSPRLPSDPSATGKKLDLDSTFAIFATIPSTSVQYSAASSIFDIATTTGGTAPCVSTAHLVAAP